VELVKARRTPALLVYLLIAVVAAGIWGPVQYGMAKAQEQERAAPPVTTDSFDDEEPEPEPVDAGDRGANGFLVLAAALRAGLLVSAIVILLHASTLLAGEATGGTWRMLLVRPVSRTDVLLAKSAMLFLMVTTFVAAVAATGWLLGLTFGGYGGYVDVRFGMALEGHAAGDLASAALRTVATAPLALFGVAAMGLFFSAIFDNSATAVIVSTLAGLAAAALLFTIPEAAGRFLFVQHVGRCADAFESLARGLSGSALSSRFLAPSVLVPAGTALVFLGGARIIFARRDIHS
jgi:ABC-2 type transport system permease protein